MFKATNSNVVGSQLQVFSLVKTECLTQPIKRKLLPKPKVLSQLFLYFWNLHQILKIWRNKDKPHSWCFSESIDCKMCGCLNASEIPCQNTYGESTCWVVQNTTESCTAVVLSYFLITLKEVQFDKFCLSTIWNLETLC